ncbi:hypothetical protein TB1_034891 [Malus domestica]
MNMLNETRTDRKRGFIEVITYKAYPASDEVKLKVRFYVPPFLFSSTASSFPHHPHLLSVSLICPRPPHRR